MRLPRKSLIAAAIVLTIAGCQAGGSDEPQTSSTPPSATVPAAPTLGPSVPTPITGWASFQGTVDLRSYGAECDEASKPEETCTLPTQFDMKILPDENVSLRDVWPIQDGTVEAVCKGDGEEYRDGKGDVHVGWYGLVVPQAKLDPRPAPSTSPNFGRIPKKVKGGYLAFVQASWIKGVEKKPLAGCSIFQ